jgi:hypothetical protein
MRMAPVKRKYLLAVWILLTTAVWRDSTCGGNGLPAFGRDTVLVWKIQSGASVSDFVVRVAEFSPDRLVEWEDEKSQGTIFMAFRDIQNAKGYVSSFLFESGMDMRGKNATTLWLSRAIYRNLKEKKRARVSLDGVESRLTYLGDDRLSVEVNRAPMTLPVVRIADDRGSERWFLDLEDNPLMVRHRLRHYNQTLVSITTDRPNTLRWIRGKKLDTLAK